MTVLLGADAAGVQNWPAGDLDGNFRVDVQDLQLFATQWLDPSGCAGLGCADFDGQNGVNMADLAIFARNWRIRTLFISEFMASNDETIEDPEEPNEFPDWLEIYNAGDETIDLSGMHLTDNPDDPTEWQIPGGITVGPNDYIIF